MVTLARARCSTLTGEGAGGAAVNARSKRTMSPALPRQPFRELAYWFNLNALLAGLVLGTKLRFHLEQKGHGVFRRAKL